MYMLPGTWYMPWFVLGLSPGIHKIPTFRCCSSQLCDCGNEIEHHHGSPAGLMLFGEMMRGRISVWIATFWDVTYSEVCFDIHVIFIYAAAVWAKVSAAFLSSSVHYYLAVSGCVRFSH